MSVDPCLQQLVTHRVVRNGQLKGNWIVSNAYNTFFHVKRRVNAARVLIVQDAHHVDAIGLR